MPKISVVILNYNGLRLLEKFLQNVIDFSPEAEVIIADNASTDDSLAFLKSDFPSLRIIELRENYGFAGGYNKALKQIHSDYFILLNSDVEVTKGWISPIVQYLELNDQYVAAQPKILDYNNREKFEYAGAAGGFIDPLGYPFCRGRVFDHIETDNGQFDRIIPVFWVTGACLFIKSKAFFEVGGFDDSFFAHMEEIDLAWRLQAKGYQLFCVPESTVYHIGGGTLNKQSSFKTYLNFKNNLLTLIKNLPLRKLYVILFTRIILDWIASLQMLLTGRGSHSASIIKAHIYVLRHFRTYFRKRGAETTHTPIRKWLLLEYFLKKNRKFTSIVPKPIISTP